MPAKANGVVPASGFGKVSKFSSPIAIEAGKVFFDQHLQRNIGAGCLSSSDTDLIAIGPIRRLTAAEPESEDQ